MSNTEQGLTILEVVNEMKFDLKNKLSNLKS